MEYIELARSLSGLLLSTVILGCLIWFCRSVLGNGNNRKALAGYINGANGVIANVGIPADQTQQLRMLETPDEERLLERIHAYNRSVKRYAVLARVFELFNKPVLLISNMGALPNGDVVITLRYDNNVLFGYRLLPNGKINWIGDCMNDWVEAHSKIIYAHRWVSRLACK